MALKNIILWYFLYLTAVLICHFIIYKTAYISTRKIQLTVADSMSQKKQIFFSLLYLLFSTGVDTLIMSYAYAGHTKIYTRIGHFGWSYLFFSILICIFLFELYFYLIHRFLHLNFFYKHIHYLHHQVKSPTVSSVFCLHPLEAIGFGFFNFLIFVFIPIHPTALIALLVYFYLGNISGHFGYEYLSLKFRTKYPLISTPSHHDLHHQEGNCNYGYAFRIFDFIFNTHQKK